MNASRISCSIHKAFAYDTEQPWRKGWIHGICGRALSSVLMIFSVLLWQAQAQSAATTTPPSHEAQQTTGFAGDWETTYGKMTLHTDEEKFHGVYLGGEATLHGKVDGATLRFEYKEPSGIFGYGVFTLSDDQTFFSGYWREGEPSSVPLNEKDRTWSGKRIIALRQIRQPKQRGLLC
jgi:hypothetical protein